MWPCLDEDRTGILARTQGRLSVFLVLEVRLEKHSLHLSMYTGEQNSPPASFEAAGVSFGEGFAP